MSYVIPNQQFLAFSISVVRLNFSEFSISINLALLKAQSAVLGVTRYISNTLRNIITFVVTK